MFPKAVFTVKVNPDALDRFSTHLIFDASIEADAVALCEWYNLNQCIPYKRQSDRQR